MNKELKKISELIIEDVDPRRIILFGSRAKDKFTDSSDYDLAIDSKNISFRIKRRLKDRIEEIIGLRSIDLVFLKDVDVDFKKIILETGKIIYER